MELGYHNGSFRAENGDPVESVIDRARRVEDAGFDWFSLMDHLWQLPFIGRRDDPFFDCYTMLPAVARETESLELSALVTCVHYRNPALLGKMMTSLDHLSGGRAVLGIGAGWFEEEYEAYGYTYPDPPKRVSQLADAVRLIKSMWTEESPITYEGEHYAVEDLVLVPGPVQDPHPPVLIGGGGEELTLRVVAAHADRWNVPGVSPREFAHKCDILASYCDEYGRKYDDIKKTVLATVCIRETTEAAHDAYERLMADTDAGPSPRDEYRGMIGTPAEVAAEIESFAERGAERMMIRALHNEEATLRPFLEEVAPTV